MNRLNIGQTILQLRKVRELTQEHLASMVGVSAAYNYSKLYIEIHQKETAAGWFKTYVEELISTKYDHHSNPYFEKIKLEVDPEGQKIIRKNTLQSIIDEDEFKVLSGIADYEKGINALTDAVAKM